MRWNQTDWKKVTVERQRGTSGRNLQATPKQRNLKTSAEAFHVVYLNWCVNMILLSFCNHDIVRIGVRKYICGFLLYNRVQLESDKEQRDGHSRRQRDKDQRGREEERKRQRHHYEFDKFMRRKEETKWGKGYCHDRAKKDGHHHGYTYCSEVGDKSNKEDRDDMGSRKERIRNKVS